MKYLLLSALAVSFPFNFDDQYVIDHDCRPLIEWPTQPRFGLIIQASPDPVLWSCDNGLHYE